MARFKLSGYPWYGVLFLSVTLAALLIGYELFYAYRMLSSNQQADLGMELEDRKALGQGQNSNWMRICDIDPESPVSAQPVTIGDYLRFARPIDRWRKFTVGEDIPVIVRDGPLVVEGCKDAVASAAPNETADSSSTTITPGEVPLTITTISALPVAADLTDYRLRVVLAVPALFFSLLIGLKGAADASNRTLALTFVALSLTLFYNFNYSPGSAVFVVAKLAHLSTYGLIWLGAAAFALQYRNLAVCADYRNDTLCEDDGDSRRLIRKDLLLIVFRFYQVFSVVLFFYNIPFALGWESTPGLWQLGLVGVLLGLLITLGGMFDTWRLTRGESRQKIGWMLGSFAVVAIPSALTWVSDANWVVVLSFAGTLMFYLGLSYAVLKHQVLNFSFVLSRTLIQTALLALLYAVLEFVKYFTGTALKGEELAFTRITSKELAAAAVMFLAFRPANDYIRKFLERVLLRNWYLKMRNLKRFENSIAEISTAEGLQMALVAALEKFTDGEKLAVYLLEPDGTYKLAVGTVENPVSPIHQDDELVVALKSEKSVQSELLENSALRYDRAFPMYCRGQLSGFVILGEQSNSASYRPDEVAIMRSVIDEAGLSLTALKLQTEVQHLQRQAEKSNLALQLMAGRRKSMRDAIESQAG